MTEQRRDAALVDVVFGYCAYHDIQPDDPKLTDLPFREVMKEFRALCDQHMEYVAISYELRQVAPICHAECHIATIRAFFEENPEWTLGDKRSAPSAKIIPFPSNLTKH